MNLPYLTREGLPLIFKNSGYKEGAEIGVLRGAFTKQLCEVGLKVYAVDPWLAFPHHLAIDPGYQKKRDALYNTAVRELSPYPNCVIIRKTSMEAVNGFRDGELDFVYIDADHGFKCIAQDIFEWSKKVRPGGVVSGHDYHLSPKCQVAPVVDAYVEAFGIKELIIIGDPETADENNRRSWMWVKE